MGPGEARHPGQHCTKCMRIAANCAIAGLAAKGSARVVRLSCLCGCFSIYVFVLTHNVHVSTDYP